MDTAAVWLPVGDWQHAADVSFELDTNPNQDVASAVAEVVSEDDLAVNASSVEGMLPLHGQLPGLYGGFWLRLVAALIDGLILGFAYYVLMFIGILPGILAGSGAGILAGYSASVLASFTGAWLYAALFQSSKLQATPGMLALGLAVTDLRGERIHFARASGRYFATFVSTIILYFGYFMIGWTQRKQGLHDMMAGTLVVRSSTRRAFRDGRLESGQAMPAGGMPVWAIVLIIIGVLFIPIMAILAAIAIPAYQNYSIRTQVSEGAVLTGGAKVGVAEYYSNRGTFPLNNTSAGVASAGSIFGKYVSQVAIKAGVITATFGNQANTAIAGDTFVLSPIAIAGSVSWTCTNSTVDQKYLPSSCRK